MSDWPPKSKGSPVPRPAHLVGHDGRNYPCEWCGEFTADAPGHLCEECAESVRPAGMRWDEEYDND